MYRSSTPRHVFYFDINPDEYFKNILITYAQDGAVVLEKTKDDLTFETNTTSCGTMYTASFQLTQEETRALDAGRPFVSVQVRLLDHGGNVITSPITKLRINKVLNDEVLT